MSQSDQTNIDFSISQQRYALRPDSEQDSNNRYYITISLSDTPRGRDLSRLLRHLAGIRKILDPYLDEVTARNTAGKKRDGAS